MLEWRGCNPRRIAPQACAVYSPPARARDARSAALVEGWWRVQRRPPSSFAQRACAGLLCWPLGPPTGACPRRGRWRCAASGSARHGPATSTGPRTSRARMSCAPRWPPAATSSPSPRRPRWPKRRQWRQRRRPRAATAAAAAATRCASCSRRRTTTIHRSRARPTRRRGRQSRVMTRAAARSAAAGSRRCRSRLSRCI